METRANYVLIGAFTLATILGVIGFLLWLANVQVSRQYAYYDVLFDNVAGLSTAGGVRFNGLPVGQVVHLELDEADPSKVRVRMEIDADTPIRTDSTAQLQSQGVTGVSYVSLSGGSSDAPLLPNYGEIEGQPSPLQSLFEGAPELLNEAIKLMEELRSVVNDDNRQAVRDLLANLASASAKLDQTLDEFEVLSKNLGTAARAIGGFTEQLGKLSDTAEVTLNTATETLNSAQGTIESATGTLNSAKEAFDTAETLMQDDLTQFIQTGTEAAQVLNDTVKGLQPSAVATVDAARTLVETRLPELTAQIEKTVAMLEQQVTTVGTDATALITQYQEVGQTAQARLEQTEGAIAAFESATVEAKAAIETINASIQQTLPNLMVDVANAADNANKVIAQIGDEVTTLSGKLNALSDEGSLALTTATETFANANTTLEAVTQAMDTAQSTLTTADEAFGTINRIVDEDVETIVADIRSAVTAFSGTVENVSTNVDKVADEILNASTSASNLIGTVDGIVRDNRRQVSDFMRVGLPQLQRFVEESRYLVNNLDRLVDRIERDPARFFLGTQASEFRR